jgi:hypothetical protein
MALIKYSAMVTAMNGSIGGTTMQLSKAGNVVKNKPRASNKSSERMQYARYKLGIVSNNWQVNGGALNPLWASLASSYITKNKMGETYTPSAFQLYMKSQAAGFDIVGGISGYTGVPYAYSEDLTGAYIQLNSVGECRFYYNTAWANTDYLKMFFSGSCSVGRTSPPGGYKQMGSTVPTFIGFVGYNVEYSTMFGNAIFGAQVFGYCQIYSTVNYVASAKTYFNTIVT